MHGPTSSLRSNIMIAFFLAVVLLGVSMTAVSHCVLRHTLGRAELADEIVQPIGRQFIQILAGLAILGMALAIGIAALLAKAITAPLRKLLRGVTEIGSGNLSATIDIAGDDEFGQLASGFNQMAEKLKHSHGELEAKVARRTVELSAINKVLSHEVMQRTEAEESLRESLSLLEATLESTADGILVLDGTGTIKNVNRQFQELWHLEVPSTAFRVGGPLPDSVRESRDEEEVLSFLETQLKGPGEGPATVRQSCQQGDPDRNGVLHLRDGRVVEYYSKPQRIGEEIVGRVWSCRDVTDRYRAQEQQAKLLRRVAEINEELSHFAYVVSHDLKAPLRGIKLIAEWLSVDYADQLAEEGKGQLRLLQSRVDRMYSLIDGVLQYSRVGRIKEETVAVDCRALLLNVIDAIAPPAHIHIEIENDLPTIECEKTRITQVLQNLLTNAVKYMDKPVGRVTVGCVPDGEFWRFHVRDNGPGIEEKHFERIFRIFQTLTPRDEFESSGVGLTLVKKIVEMYGGRVWVESEVGEGSTLFFTLPRNLREPGDDPGGISARPESTDSGPVDPVLQPSR